MGRTALAQRPSATNRQTIKPHHRGMARALLAGCMPADLAVRYGFSLIAISNIMNSDMFKAEMQRLESMAEDVVVDAHKELKSLQPRCIEVISEALHKEEASNSRTRTAFDLLDRTGHHARNEGKSGDDNRRINIFNFAPMPGEDPEAAKARLATMQMALKASEEAGLKDEEFLPEFGE